MAEKSVWLVGHHAVTALLKTHPERALEAHVVINSRSAAQFEILDLLRSLGIPIHSVDKPSLTKHCGAQQHQGIGLRAQAKKEGSQRDLEALLSKLIDSANKQPLLLILDQVQDPHNFGACLRTADAAGVDAVIVAKDNASPITPVVRKVASGAAETLAIFRVVNLARSIDALKRQGIWIIGASGKASQSLYQQDLSGAVAIVMGAEGKGMRQMTEKKCDALVSLPMAGSIIGSLNVSVAAGICLYEAVRQRALQQA